MKPQPSRTTHSRRSDSRARRILRHLSEAVSESAIAQRIDDPIDRALKEYLAAHEVPTVRAEFLGATADLLRTLYRQSSIGIELSAEAAEDEVVYLLESGYRGIHTGGYEGALIDMSQQGHLNPASVWRELANIVKTRRRARYMAYVKARFLDGLDWETLLTVTEILKARCRRWMPEPLQALPCELVVYEILSLLLSDQASDAQLQQILRGAWHD